MRYAAMFLTQLAVVVAGTLAAQYVINNSRTVRRLVGPL